MVDCKKTFVFCLAVKSLKDIDFLKIMMFILQVSRQDQCEYTGCLKEKLTPHYMQIF